MKIGFTPLKKFFSLSRLNIMFSSLKHKNFKLFVEGQSLSLIGTWIQRIAVNWIAYKMTNSMFWLGAVNFSESIPIFFLAPFGGIIADRWSKHKILLITQSLALLQSLIFASIYFLGALEIWSIILLNLCLGVINAIDMPVRQSFVHEMIDNCKKDLTNAIALNSTMVNTARLIGPSIAGILIAFLNEGWCFILNSISFVAVVVSLLRMQIIPTASKLKKGKNILHEFIEGAKYSFSTVPIKYFLFLMILVGLIKTALPTLAPAFAKITLSGDSQTYGFLIGAWGIGALLSAFYLLNKQNISGLESLISIAVLVFGGSMIALAFSKNIIFAMAFMGTAGIALLLEMASTNSLLQTLSDESYRGRVMSFYAISNRGMSPFGAIIAGFWGNLSV